MGSSKFSPFLLQPCFISLTQVIIGAMDAREKFLSVEEDQCFLQLMTSLDLIVISF